MGGTRNGPGGRLRRARTARGLSQEQLAKAAGISVRTVRALENDQVSRPHTESLHRLAGALRIPGPQRERFTRAWHAPALQATFTEVVGDGVNVETILHAGGRTDTGHRTLASLNHMVLGADHRPRRMIEQRVIEATRDGLTHRWMMWGHEPGQDLTRVAVRDVIGGTVAERRILPDTDVLAVRVDLPHALTAGETCYIELAWEFTGSYPDPSAAVGCSEYLHGFRAPPESLVLNVSFDGPPPSKLWEASGPDPHEADRIRPITCHDRTVSLVYHHPAPGIRGMQWSW